MLLDDPAVERIYTAGRLLRLRERYGDQRLEAACERALLFAEPAYTTVKRILANGLDREDVSQPPEAGSPLSAPARTFARTAGELLGHLFRGAAWN